VEHWRVVVGREGTVGGNWRISAFDCSGEEGYSVGLQRNDFSMLAKVHKTCNIVYRVILYT
jgi:hypothetical protein